MNTTTQRTVKAWIVSDKDSGEILFVAGSRAEAGNTARGLYARDGRNAIAEHVTLAVVADEQ